MMGIRETILRKLAEGPVYARNWKELAPKLGFDNDPTRQSLHDGAAAVLDELINQGLVTRVPEDDNPMQDPRMGRSAAKTQAYYLTAKGEEALKEDRATVEAAPAS